MVETELINLLGSANINLNRITAAQIEDVIMKVTNKVIAAWGEPAVVKYRGEAYYRYKHSKKRKLTKDIQHKNRSEVISDAYEILYGDTEIKRDYTVEEVYYEWRKMRESVVATTTFKREGRDWNHIKDFPIMKRKIGDVKVSHLKNMLDIYCGDHKVRDKDLKNILSLLRNIWQYGAVLDAVTIMAPELLKSKNFKTMQPKSDEEKRDEVFTREETAKIRRYLESKKRDTYEQAILFASYSGGLRISELRALQWNEYDEATGKLRVYYQMVRRADGSGHSYVAVRVAHTKGNAGKGRRILNLSSPARCILEEMRAVNGDKEYIFQSGGNLPISENKFNERLKKCCEAAGIRYFSSHKFRFRFASDCFEAHVDDRITQETLGHSDVRTTELYNRSDRFILSHEKMDAITNY